MAPEALNQAVLPNDLGEEILQQGGLGNRLIMDFTKPQSIVSVNGFYTSINGLMLLPMCQPNKSVRF